MTKAVFILHPGKANYPEISAYSSYLSERGFRVSAGTLDDYQQLSDKAGTVLWAIMGFYRQSLPAAMVIHDYRSLSVGGLVQVKDLAKRYLNVKPSLRIFQNGQQRRLMGFKDGIPSILLPMGIPGWIFEEVISSQDHYDGASLCYLGEMSRERGFDKVLAAFERRFAAEGQSLLLIGQPEPQIHDRFRNTPGIRFAGKLPQREALKLVAASRVAICYFPYHRPHCYQTPTKLLEYAALGKPIICNDSPANLDSCAELGINSVITGANIFGSLTTSQIELARTNDPLQFRRLEWNAVIDRSGILNYL